MGSSFDDGRGQHLAYELLAALEKYLTVDEIAPGLEFLFVDLFPPTDLPAPRSERQKSRRPRMAHESEDRLFGVG